MDNWTYKSDHPNCLCLKNRQNNNKFCFHDSGVFQANKIVINDSLENVRDFETESFHSLHPVEHDKGFAFLSNEVKQLYPNLVFDDGIDYNSLVSLCIKELQDLKKRLNELEGISTPCSAVSAEITLDNIYSNNTLGVVSGINTSFYSNGPTGMTGTTGTTGTTGMTGPTGTTGTTEEYSNTTV